MKKRMKKTIVSLAAVAMFSTSLANFAGAESYTVQPGDSLYKISVKYNTTVSNLKSWNKLSSDMIYVNQVLTVNYMNDTLIPTEYIVQSGDSLYKIAVKFGVSIQQLKEWNQLTSEMIFVGQKLVVNENNVNKLLSVAKSYIGTPYVWGGVTPSGFDCSGFIYYVFNQVGKNINRTSAEGYFNITNFVQDPKPGDLVFFKNTYKQGISHMGIYLGNNEFIHASTSKGVIISKLDNVYYQPRFVGFKQFN